jgi:Fic family protein
LDQLEKLFRKAQNIYRVHELVDSIVMGASEQAPFRFSEDVVKRLHSVAMDGLLDRPGMYRTGNVQITNSPHKCANWIEVDAHMGSLVSYVVENWEKRNLLHLSSFVLWRLCWVHPFQNGNGRTARAASYLVLCAKNGQLFKPKNTIIQQIQANKEPYYAALRYADELYAATQDVDHALAHFEALMGGWLKEQIKAGLQ